MPQRLITLVTSALLIGGLFVGAPVRVQAVTDTVYVADVLDYEYAGGSCDSPDFTTNLTVDVATIQEAINAVVEIPSLTTVFLCPGTYTINASLVASGDIILEGASAGSTILDGGATWDDEGYVTGGVQILDAADDVTIRNLTFRHGFATSGGAIHADTVTVTNSTFTNNRATVNGGAIYSNVFIASDSTFTNNSNSTSGGAIYAFTVTVTNSRFIGNDANVGGAIIATTAIITASNFTDNDVTYSGGAIYAPTVTVTNSNFTDNDASDLGVGGAIATFTAATVTRSRFIRNTAGGDGGAIFLRNSGTSSVTGSTFTSNIALSGGAINFVPGPGSEVLVSQNLFTKNEARYGGATDQDDNSGQLNFRRNVFTANRAIGEDAEGGALWVSNATFSGDRFSRNRSDLYGGAVYASNRVVARAALRSKFTSNRARRGQDVYYTR